MHKKALLILFPFIVVFTRLPAQKEGAIYFKGAIKENRIKLHRNIIQHTITSNLSLPLNAETEESWVDAFGGIALLHYTSPWADGRVNVAFDSLEKRSTYFQRALLELAYARYPNRYMKQVNQLLQICRDAKIFAMCAEYLLLDKQQSRGQLLSLIKKRQLVRTEQDEAILSQLASRLEDPLSHRSFVPLSAITHPGFLKNRTILYSFQRRNRNYQGLAMIRDSAGNFVRSSDGSIFSVPQLARSINNLPGYLTNGNTPQGIFRMFGFDTSKTYFIGPTTNVQLTMPVETSIMHFFGDSTITDTVWTEEWYKKLLPGSLKQYRPLFESFYAGKAGRTEIIAHGTTIDPELYAGELFYPQTPTMGCLCTMERWSDKDGERLESDQERLAAAILKAGGANGYCVVIEIDDSQKPVTISDILPLLKQ